MKKLLNMLVAAVFVIAVVPAVSFAGDSYVANKYSNFPVENRPQSLMR